jgi:hypothetical protein
MRSSRGLGGGGGRTWQGKMGNPSSVQSLSNQPGSAGASRDLFRIEQGHESRYCIVVVVVVVVVVFVTF